VCVCGWVGKTGIPTAPEVHLEIDIDQLFTKTVLIVADAHTNPVSTSISRWIFGALEVPVSTGPGWGSCERPQQ